MEKHEPAESKYLKEQSENLSKVKSSPEETNETSAPSLVEINVVTVTFGGGVECKFLRDELSSISEFFRALLRGDFIEKNQNTIGLQHVPFDFFFTLLSCYRNQISWMEKLEHNDGGDPATSAVCQSNILLLKSTDLQHNITNVCHAWNLLEYADMLGLQQAASICDRYICRNISLQNAEKYYLLATKFSRTAVINEILRAFATEKFGKAIDRYSALNVIKKEDVYYTLKNKATASSNIYLLAKSFKPSQIAFDLKKIEALEASRKRHRFSHYFYVIGGYNFSNKSNTICWRINSDEFVRHVQREASESSALSKVAKVVTWRKSIKPNESTSKTSNLYEKLPNFPEKEIEDYRTIAIGTLIYVIGGMYYDALEAVNDVWIYDTRGQLWKKAASMKHKRCHHAVTSLGGRIYACGGYDGCSLVHTSAETFDPKKNVWISLPDMPVGVGNAASTGCGICIYVICGQFGVKNIQTTRQLQEYNTKTRQWSTPSEYNSPVFRPFSEYGLSCGVVGDEIFMVGGQTVRVDAYNVKTKTWRRRADMKHKRIDACTLTYRGRLLVAGGYEYDTGQYFDTTEVYNIESNTWTVLSCRLPIESKNVGLCYIFDVEQS